MRNGICSFYSLDRSHWYERVAWRDGRIVWRMWSSWSNAKGVIDWVPIKNAALPKSLLRAGVVDRMKTMK